jgi:hypothetical protein
MKKTAPSAAAPGAPEAPGRVVPLAEVRLDEPGSPLVPRVSDFPLGPDSEDRQVLLQTLQRLPDSSLPARVLEGWHTHFEQPLARLFECGSGQGGFAHGMGAMLVLPARSLTAFAAAGSSVFGDDAVTVIGASLPGTTEAGMPLLPRVYGFDPGRLESHWRPPRDRHAQAMSMPALLPGWRAAPGRGLHAGWQALAAAPESAESTLARWIAGVARRHRAALWPATAYAVRRCLPDPAGGAALDDLAARLQAAEQALGERIAQAFVRHLDAVVAHGCPARRGALRPAEYNWIAGGDTAFAWQWRMDAREIFPGLCTSSVPPTLPIVVPATMTRRSPVRRRLKRWAEDPVVRGAYTLCEAVDQGLPLVRHLARAFSVKPATVRALRGVSVHEAPLLQASLLGWPDLLRTLDAIAPERHPGTPETWQAFGFLYTEGLHAWRVVHGLDIGAGQHFLSQVLRPWLARAGSDWHAAATRWRDGFRHADGLHLASSLGQDLKLLISSPRLPAPRRAGLVEVLGRAPMAMWQRMVEARAAWPPPQAPRAMLADEPEAAVTRRHPLAAGLAGREYLQRHAGPWHQLADELDLDVGLPVSALNSMDRLRQESQWMHHCIHTYGWRLQSSPQLAFAVGRDHAVDRSTVLLGYQRHPSGAWEVRVLEHKPERNRPPSPGCVAAVARLVMRLAARKAHDAMNRVEHARVMRVEAIQAFEATLDAALRDLSPPRRPADTERRAADAAVAEAVDRALHVLERVRLWGAPGECAAKAVACRAGLWSAQGRPGFYAVRRHGRRRSPSGPSRQRWPGGRFPCRVQPPPRRTSRRPGSEDVRPVGSLPTSVAGPRETMDLNKGLGRLLWEGDEGLFVDDPRHGTTPVGAFQRPPGLVRALVFPLPLQWLGAQAAQDGVVHVLAYLGSGRIRVSTHDAAALSKGEFWQAVATAPPIVSAVAGPGAWLAAYFRSRPWAAYVDAVYRWLAARAPQERLAHGALRSALRTLVETALHRGVAEFEAALVDCEDEAAIARYRVMRSRFRQPGRALVPALLRDVEDPRAHRRLLDAQLRLPPPLLQLAALPSPFAAGLRAALMGQGRMTEALQNAQIAPAVAMKVASAPGEIPASWSASRFLAVARMACCLEARVLPDRSEGWAALAEGVAVVRKLDERAHVQCQYLRWIFGFGPLAATSRAAALEEVAVDLRSGEYYGLSLRRSAVGSILAAMTRSPHSGPGALRRRLKDRWSAMRQDIARRAAKQAVGRADPSAALHWVAAAAPRWIGVGTTRSRIRLRLLDSGSSILEHGRRASNCLESVYSVLRYLAAGRALVAIESGAGRTLGTMAIQLPAHRRGGLPSISEMSGMANVPLLDEVAAEVQEIFRRSLVEGYEHQDWAAMIRRSRRLGRAMSGAMNEVVERGLT